MGDIVKIEHLPEALRRNSIWLLVLGAILIIGGFAALLSPFVASLFVLSIIGFVFLFAGAAQVIQAFSAQGWKGATMHTVAGVLYTLGGLLILVEPLAGLLAVTLIVVATFIAGGIVRIVAALQVRPDDGWGWIALSGAVSLLAGAIIWANYPASATILLGLVAGVSFLIEGWGMITIGLAARRLSSELGPGGEA